MRTFTASRIRLALALVTAPVLLGLTQPITGAVALPDDVSLSLPFPAGASVRISAGYSSSGGSSLHADTNETSKANDHDGDGVDPGDDDDASAEDESEDGDDDDGTVVWGCSGAGPTDAGMLTLLALFLRRRR